MADTSGVVSESVDGAAHDEYGSGVGKGRGESQGQKRAPRDTHDQDEERGGRQKEGDRVALLQARVEELLVEEFGLGALGKAVVQTWLRKMASDPVGLERVRDWFLLLVNQCTAKKSFQLRRRAELFNAWQLGCPDLIPGLRAIPFWEKEPSLKAAVETLESRFPEIAAELCALRSEELFQPYRAPNWVNPDRLAKDGVGSLGHDRGDWDVCYLYLHNVNFSENRTHFPAACQAIEQVKGWYCHAFISVLRPGTHVAKHHGPTNKKLRLHLALEVPSPDENGIPSSGIRVGGDERSFQLGKCVTFDDSFEHEAWNNHPTQSRVCLIMDIWHPDLSEREIKLLTFLEKGKMKKAKNICDSAALQTISDNAHAPSDQDDVSFAGNNFFALLEHTRHLKSTLHAKGNHEN